MRRLLKILKWTGIVLLLLIAIATITVMSRQNLKYNAPYPRIEASRDSAVIMRGRHLVFGAAHCVDCHSTVNADSLLASGQEVPLSGGLRFDLPIGKMYTRNITQDSLTGIGRYTDSQLARSLRYGVGVDGRALFDFMPYHNTSDEDLRAIISYLRTQKAVRNEVPDHSYNFMGKIVKAFLLKPVGPNSKVAVSVKEDSTETYGRYLAVEVANCQGCHTKRDPVTAAYTGEPFTGGLELEGFITPCITADSSSRIFSWNQQNFIDRFRKGKLNPKSPMPWNSYKRMTDDELKAIYKFLKTLNPPPVQFHF